MVCLILKQLIKLSETFCIITNNILKFEPHQKHYYFCSKVLCLKKLVNFDFKISLLTLLYFVF